MTGAGQPRGGMAGWIGRHPRGAGLVAVGGAVVLLGVAAVVAFVVLAGARPVGNTDPTPTPAPTATTEPSLAPSPEPPASDAPSVEPSATPEPGMAHLPWPPAPDLKHAGHMVAGRLWLVAMVNGLSVRSGPGTEHPVVGSLDAGDLALALDGYRAPDTWIPVLVDGASGFAYSGLEEDPYLLPTPTPWKAFGEGLSGVASDGASYVAYGPSREGQEYLPYEGGGELTLVQLSGDGVSWSSVSRPGGSVRRISIGTGGMVAVTHFYPGAQIAQFSADGENWDTLAGGARTAAYGPAGWVILDGQTARRSSDGRTWSETLLLPISEYGVVDIESSDGGYLAFVPGGRDRPWASTDGIAWAAVDVPMGIDDWVSDAELVGDRVYLLTGEPDTTRAWLHRGRLLAAGGVTWDGPPIRIDDGAYSIANISAGADGLLATGWATDSLSVATWSSIDGSAWTRLAVSDGALGGSVLTEPAWGAAGWVTVGASPDGRGTQLWRSADGANWEPTGDPVAYAGPLPPCPPAEAISTLLLMYLEPYAGTCLGDASVTIRGWVPHADQLWCCWLGSPEPLWLARSFRPVVQPGEAEQHFYSWLTLHVPDGVDTALLSDHAWVEITGHYRDAASSTCRLVPQRRLTSNGELPSEYGIFKPFELTGATTMLRRCEENFVVEVIRP